MSYSPPSIDVTRRAIDVNYTTQEDSKNTGPSSECALWKECVRVYAVLLFESLHSRYLDVATVKKKTGLKPERLRHVM